MTSTGASLAISDPTLEAFAREVGPAAAPTSDRAGDSDPVTVVGAKTAWDRGPQLTGIPREVRAPAGIVAYAPEEMTVTVRAGTPVSELANALADTGQRCALPDRGGTVGGAIAVGENDLLMLGKGRLRDSVLQVRYVSADGQLVTGGGPTVKNVTGFDLPRLLTGSLGTLGFLAEVILRTNPSPARSVWYHSDQVDPFALHDSLLKPGAILWDGSETWVLLEGHGVDVEAEADVLRSSGPFAEIDGPPTLPPHRWSLAPAELRSLPFDDYVASVGVGTVFAGEPQPPRPIDPVVAEVTARLKSQFDPNGRLNPGRSG